VNVESRQYTSPLRAEQAKATRERILDAAIELLHERNASDVAMPDVAKRAGVALRTAYRAFPTRDALFDGVVETIKHRFANAAGPQPTSPEEFIENTTAGARAVFAVGAEYRALFAFAAGREAHQRGAPRRMDAIREAFDTELAALSSDQAHAFVAMVYLVTSSNAVLFLEDYAGFDAEEAGAAIRWALTAFVTAARHSQSRTALKRRPR
jgi:AcrR family transcriptional regulator